jgi:indole-3-glycerol phosphate synthase
VDLERRRQQNLASPRQDPRGVTPSIRNFALAIDSQRQRIERIPLLKASRPDLVELCIALDDAEVAAIAIDVDNPPDELPRMQEAASSVSVPVLRTDLLLEEFQIYQSRAAGADAVLLQQAALPFELLARMAQAAKSAHMAACIACRNLEDISRVTSLQPAVIAVPPLLAVAKMPPRALVLALEYAEGVKADAALDETLDSAEAFRRILET